MRGRSEGPVLRHIQTTVPAFIVALEINTLGMAVLHRLSLTLPTVTD